MKTCRAPQWGPAAHSQNPHVFSEQELKTPQIRGFIHQGKENMKPLFADCPPCQGAPAASPALHKHAGQLEMPTANFHLPAPAVGSSDGVSLQRHLAWRCPGFQLVWGSLPSLQQSFSVETHQPPHRTIHPRPGPGRLCWGLNAEPTRHFSSQVLISSVSSEPALTQYASESEVTKFDDRVLCYQDVFWLYISVDALETNKQKKPHRVRSKR